MTETRINLCAKHCNSLIHYNTISWHTFLKIGFVLGFLFVCCVVCLGFFLANYSTLILKSIILQSFLYVSKNSQYRNQNEKFGERIWGTVIFLQWLQINIQEFVVRYIFCNIQKQRHKGYGLDLFMWLSNYFLFLYQGHLDFSFRCVANFAFFLYRRILKEVLLITISVGRINLPGSAVDSRNTLYRVVSYQSYSKLKIVIFRA